MPLERSTLPITTLGILPVALPVVRFGARGQGKKIVFIAGQHGNEATPLFIFHRLEQWLSTVDPGAGSLTMLPVTNPLGLLFGTRREPLDGENLNREAPGSTSKSFGKRLAAALWQQCEEADLIVDFHTFSRNCGLIGLMVRTGASVDQRALESLACLQPDCVWQIDMTRMEDQRFDGALDLVAAQRGIAAITLEMKQHLTITEYEIERIIEVLKRLLIAEGIVGGERKKPQSLSIPIYNGHYLYSDWSGIFMPEVQLYQPVRQEDRLGTIVDLVTGECRVVTSSMEGVVLTIRYRDIVRTGTKIGSIGSRIGTLER